MKMGKFYCSKCRRELNKSEVRAKINSLAQQDGSSVHFYNVSDYYCVKHLIQVQIVDKSIKNQNGFIQIPLLITIIVGVLILGGVSYFGIKQYQSYKIQKTNELEASQQEQKLEQNKNQAEQQARDLEIENLKKEVETLKNKKPQVIVKENPPAKTYDLASIIAEWRPRTAYLECHFDLVGIIQGGSGFLITYNNSVLLSTNAHVATMDVAGETYAADYCNVSIPNDTQIVTVKGVHKPSNASADYVGFIVTNPSALMKGLKTTESICKTKASIGDEVVIVGYPSIGSLTDVTATEGIISGYDGEYYITSAKIEHGNSGGIAVLVKDDCNLGIPTAVVAGSLESLGRILDYHYLLPSDSPFFK